MKLKRLEIENEKWKWKKFSRILEKRESRWSLLSGQTKMFVGDQSRCNGSILSILPSFLHWLYSVALWYWLLWMVDLVWIKPKAALLLYMHIRTNHNHSRVRQKPKQTYPSSLNKVFVKLEYLLSSCPLRPPIEAAKIWNCEIWKMTSSCSYF